jgi:long-chain acyl-CoA synthetase
MEGANKENSVGIPLPGTIIEITDRDDPHKVLAQGEIGEICITGPQVMKGYWGREEATASAMVGGRFHSGDVGYMDEDGYTFIIDRIKDLVLVSGFNVYPRNVEEGIYQHPAVEEVTVIGIPDEYSGQSVKAFVKLREGQSLDSDGLIAFLRDVIGKHEIPKSVEFRSELPKTMIGKLSKKELVAEETAIYEAAHPAKGAAAQ